MFQAQYLVAISALLAATALGGCNSSGSSTNTGTGTYAVATIQPRADATHLTAGASHGEGQNQALQIVHKDGVTSLERQSGGPVFHANPVIVGGLTQYAATELPSGKAEYYSNAGGERLTVIDTAHVRHGHATLADPERTRIHHYGKLDPNQADAGGMTGTATYSGTADAQLIDTTGNYDMKGRMTMSADFGAGTVDGTIDRIELTDTKPGASYTKTSDAVVSLNNGIITGDAYNGTVTVTRDGQAWVTGGPTAPARYEGQFFGANAEETAGTVIVQGTDPVLGASRIIGGFVAAKN